MNQILVRGEDFALTEQDIDTALASVGVRPGQTLVVHSSLFNLGALGDVRDKNEFAAAFLRPLERAVGPEGTLLLPTFTFSFFGTRLFDHDDGPSESGLLSEAARTAPGYARTLHPVYSYAVKGRLARTFLDCRDDTSFGPGSVYDRMHEIGRTREDVHFLILGEACPPRVLSYVHYLEQKFDVPYRALIRVEGLRRRAGQEEPVATDFYGRNRDERIAYDERAVWDIWTAAKAASFVPLGASLLCRAPEPAVHDATLAALADNPRALYRQL